MRREVANPLVQAALPGASRVGVSPLQRQQQCCQRLSQVTSQCPHPPPPGAERGNSCLPFASTEGSPWHPNLPTLQHPGPSPTCLPPPSTRAQPRGMPTEQSCLGALAPASHC